MFLKKFDYSKEMHKMRDRFTDRLLHYGLIGECRVAYQLQKIDKYAVCLYNIRLFSGFERAQFDFLIILKDCIIIVEVKNLLGNLTITEDFKFLREIYKNDLLQVSGMDNPFIQLDYQKKILQKFLSNKIQNQKIETLLVMANDKMIINNNSNRKDIIKYDELIYYLNKFLSGEVTDNELSLGYYILENDISFNYKLVPIIKKNIVNQYTPNFKSRNDLELFLRIVDYRTKIAKEKNIPTCNIFSNKEAELLVINKPKSKEEFISIKGFKEKRYEMYGEDIIKIFKNN